jgi:hypothetical protein
VTPRAANTMVRLVGFLHRCLRSHTLRRTRRLTPNQTTQLGSLTPSSGGMSSQEHLQPRSREGLIKVDALIAKVLMNNW